MAKNKKSTQTNNVRKNAWSVVSIWWGILVFGLLIPALFLATCLDINSYKKAVWAYVEDEKGKLEQFNKDLDAEIKKTEAEIRDLEDKIAKLEGVTYDFLDPLYNVITKLESYALAYFCA